MTAQRRQAAIVVAVVVVLLVATQLDASRAPLGTVLYGALYGSLNGLLAIGLVLTYRISRTINFAYGALGGAAASIGVGLFGGEHWPWGLAIVMGLLVGAGFGAGLGALINWRFSRAPRLVVTVATIGLAQVFGGFATYVPQWLHTPTRISLAGFQTSLNSLSYSIRPVLFTGNELLILILVPVTVAFVGWFLLRTDAGRAVRAIADNGDRARLLGIPARRLLLMVWAISGVVAALAVLLAAPDQGVALTATAGPTLLLAPLAAAVVARMENLWLAFSAAVLLGVVQSITGLNVSKQSVSSVVLLVVVVAALLLQTRSSSRAEASDESSWSGLAAVRPIPPALRNLPEVRITKYVGIVLLVGLTLSLPAILPVDRLDQVTGAVVFALAALSLVILSGWGGTISLGQMALVGVGAITAGDLMQHENVDLFLALAAGGAVAAVAALIVGLPALRVKGLFLAVTTLAFAVAADDFFFNSANFPHALPSDVLRPILWKRFNLSGEGDLYLLCIAILALTIVLIQGLRHSRSGRALLATRDNLRGAEAAAVPTTRVRLTAFAISGLIAGVAGGLYVVIYGSASSTGSSSAFPSSASLLVFSMAVIGGLTSIGGTLSGVALLEVIGIAFPKTQLLLSGVGLLVVLMVFPAGLAGITALVRDRLLAIIARRRGLEVSVWADGTANADPTDDPASVDALAAIPAPRTAPSLDDTDGVLLRCDNVNASYGSLQVLFGIDLTIHEGEILALLGTNGAGKSSLLKAITGLLPTSKGEIWWAGESIGSESTERIAGRGLTMMPGGRGIFASLTVAENLRVASWSLRGDRSAANAARGRAFTMFPALQARSSVGAGNLSGGEQQQLSLAMAFLIKPRLLCIDELSLGLSPTVVADLIDAVRAIHDQGTTVVIVEQSVNVALLLAERAVFLEKGQVRFSGPAAELLDRPDLLRAVFIGGGETAPKEKPARPSRRKVIAEVTEPAPALVAAASDVEAHTGPALQAYGLVKRFGGITALDHVDLVVEPREVVGLIGHNGAGKTTLFDALSGFLRPDEGKIILRGIDVTGRPAYERSVGGLGRSFQEARLYPTLDVAETISVSLERHLPNRDPFAAAFRLPASTDSEARAALRVDEIIELLGLGAYRHRATGQLSTGTRRIVELACIVGHKPSLLMLDEPTAGVAQAETEALGPLLRTVANEIGCAMVVIEHDMTMISNLCDRLVALELGAIIAEGTPAKVLASDAVISSYLGTNETSVARSGHRPVAIAAKARTKTLVTARIDTSSGATVATRSKPHALDKATVLTTTKAKSRTATATATATATTTTASTTPAVPDPPVDLVDPPAPTPPTGGGKLATFRAGLGPVGLTALFVLAGLAVAQSFDSSAFGVLSPEIKKSFHLDNAGIDIVSGLTGALPLLGSVIIGNLGDRRDRIKITRWSGLLWGVTAILTGLSPVLAVLVIARLIGGIGLLSSQTIYPSLLSDYYPEEKRAQVFTVFLLASTGLGLAASPLAGGLGSLLGWRSTFVLLAIPTFIFVFLLKLIQEPRRRHQTAGDEQGASSEELPGAASLEVGNMRQSFRELRTVRTLRRIWLGAFILGGAAAPLTTLVSTYLKDVFGTGDTGRGFIVAIVGIGGLFGLALSGAWAQRTMSEGKSKALPLVTGAAAFTFGVFLLGFALAPVLWLTVLFGFFAGIGLGGFLPPYTTLVSLITPSRLRSQAYAWSTMFFAFGAIAVSVIVGSLADSVGQRAALSVLAVLVLIGGVVVITARRFVEHDQETLRDAEEVATT